jgi:hypothetical protein
VELLALSKFLSKLETGRRAIVVTRLHAKPSSGTGGNELDVTLTAAAWERTKETRPRPASGR